jgi:hypothetical protein
MTPENRNTPAWAQRERQADLGWMRIDCIRAENLDAFSAIASVAFENTGRGAIVVDTTSQAMPGAGHPFGYFFQDQIKELGDEDTNCMVTGYEPAQEFVVVLLKPQDCASTYRLGAVARQPQEAVASEGTPNHTSEPAAESELEPPDVETLIAWEAEGGCEAACPHGCWVEPDGVCIHGHPSWLLKLGLI